MCLKRTTLALAITGLSIGLLGCATRPSPTPAAEVPIVVPLREDPPAELLACAERPAGLPVDARRAPDVVGADSREALERVFPAFGRNADRLDRWVNWLSPGMCPPPDS